MKLDTVFIEITNVCDKSCKHCFNATFNNIIPSEIRMIDFKNIVIFLKSIGVKQLKIVGGEPTFHSDFESIISVLESSGISYTIFCDHINIIKHLDILRRSKKLNHIRISVDGNQEVHDYIRGEGSYAEMMDVIKELICHKISVKINYTINKLNYKCIKEVYKTACSLGVDISYSVIKICKNEFSKELQFDEIEINKLIEEIPSLMGSDFYIVSNILRDIADDKAFINDQKCNSNTKHIGCLAGQNNCVVDSYGNVWPCSLLKGEEQYNYGNIIRNNPVEIITKMNAEWSNLCRTFEECDKCNYSLNCTGGCRSNAYYSEGIEGKDPFCKLYSNLYYGLDNSMDIYNYEVEKKIGT